jgi:hypothetical protein
MWMARRDGVGRGFVEIRSVLLATTALTSAFAIVSTGAGAATTSFINSYGSTSAPSSIDGAFDISSFLNQEALAGQQVTINSATVQVYGYSAPNNSYTQTYLGQYVAGYAAQTGYAVGYYYYSCGWGDTCQGTYYYSYTYYVPVYGSAYNVTQGDLQVDSVLVDFGSQQLSANDSHPNTYAYSNSYYASFYTTIGNDFGTVSDSAPLGSVGLADLMNNSVLQYVLNTQLGQFSGLNVELDLTFTATATPLPAALPLFATGLGGLGLLGWRRRRKVQGVA